MGNISRTLIWSILTVIICFLLAWGINRHRTQSKEPASEGTQQGVKVPANPGGNWPQFHGNQAQTGMSQAIYLILLNLYGDSRQVAVSNHLPQFLII